MAWFQDFYLFLMGIMYWDDSDIKICYYDCNTLMQVSLGAAKEIYRDLLSRMYHNLKKTYSEEYKISKRRLPIKLKCSVSTLKNALYHAESLGDNSLRECLYRLRNYRRIAVNQLVQIYKDFDEHSFTFTNTANGICSINGGIIRHSNKEKTYWQIHT